MKQIETSAQHTHHRPNPMQSRDRDSGGSSPCGDSTTNPLEPPDDQGGTGGMPAPLDPHGSGNGGKEYY